jgi:archaemetzincin
MNHAPAAGRAGILLDELTGHTPGTHRIVVGLTAKDISVTKDQHEDRGIFGLGQIDGRTCVVSTFRLGARGADEAKLRERLPCTSWARVMPPS